MNLIVRTHNQFGRFSVKLCVYHTYQIIQRSEGCLERDILLFWQRCTHRTAAENSFARSDARFTILRTESKVEKSIKSFNYVSMVGFFQILILCIGYFCFTFVQSTQKFGTEGYQLLHFYRARSKIFHRYCVELLILHGQ